MVESEPKRVERATIQAVASRAGVSATTVSLVLSGKGDSLRISKSTHVRVQAAADELNYAPNLGIRSIRGDRTHILSFFSTYRNRVRGDLYMNSLASAVEQAGGDAGYDILVHCNFARSTKEIYQFLNGDLTDGLLLFAPRPSDPLLALLRNSNLPVVIMDGNGPDPLGQYSSVEDDVEAAMRLVVENLVTLGHRDIAAMTALEESPDSDRRVALLRKYLDEYGIDLPEHRLIKAGESNAHDVVAALREDSRSPTAVFCWHDRLAYAILSACEMLGVQVPEELSVVGYDGLHWPSRSRQIAASVRVDLDGLASSAVRLLNKAISDPDQVVEHLIQPVSFLRGTSLGPPSATEQSHDETCIYPH